MRKLFYGGDILTLGEDEPYTGAVLTDNRRIIMTGTLSEVSEYAKNGDCERIDLEGGTLIPGFIDPHSHFTQVAYSFLEVSLDGACTAAEMRARIEAFIKERNVRPGEWINANEYDNNSLPGAVHLPLSEIDALAPGYKLVIRHKSGHMGLFNSSALAALGIGPDTPDPEGGRIGRESGRLTGYVEENAFFEYLRKIPAYKPEQLLDGCIKAQQLYASYGITTLQDGMVVQEMLPLYQMLLERGVPYLDFVLYASPECYEKAVKLTEAFPKGRFRLGGMKIFLDGSPQGRTAWMRTPYLGEPVGYRGYGTMTDREVEAAMEYSAEKKTQLIAHCNGDAAVEQFLRCLEKTEEKYPLLRSLKPVIIHAQLIGRDQLVRAAELGAMASFFVAHVYHWGDVHIRNFGADRAASISPSFSAKRAGLTFTFHQDSPVIRPDMLETVWCAVSRVTRGGVKLGANEAIGVYDALSAVTLNGAIQYGEEHLKGSISAGKFADLAVLSKNPLKCRRPEEIRDIKVLKTYKEGNQVFDGEEAYSVKDILHCVRI